MDLSKHTNRTVEAIYQHYEANRKDPHRPHLGGSQIGLSCSRALWYQFRWAASGNPAGRVLRLFETGDREEERLVRNLRDIGVEVWQYDEEGNQFRATAHGGHFALSVDGVGRGFIESSKPHVLEFKTADEKSFNKMRNHGLEKAHPQYWAQVHVGMYLMELDRAYFIMVNKNTDDIYGERVTLDKAFAKSLIDKAGQIIFAETPPPKIAETDDWYECKFCRYRAVCQRGHVPEVNCRTCAHSTPEPDGTWSCAIGNGMQTCSEHVFRPDMMPWEVHDAGQGWVEYVTADGEVIRNEGNSWNLWEERQP